MELSGVPYELNPYHSDKSKPDLMYTTSEGAWKGAVKTIEIQTGWTITQVGNSEHNISRQNTRISEVTGLVYNKYTWIIRLSNPRIPNKTFTGGLIVLGNGLITLQSDVLVFNSTCVFDPDRSIRVCSDKFTPTNLSI